MFKSIRVFVFSTTAASALSVLAGCAGISDCREDAQKCAEMLNTKADKCAFSFQLVQGDEKRKICENAI
jgi:hypothetical protein